LSAARLLVRLRDAGFDDVQSVELTDGGVAAVAGFATRASGQRLFAKTFVESLGADVFSTEAEGLSVLADNGVATPAVALVTADLLVLHVLPTRRDDEAWWEQLAHVIAHLHLSTVSDRFGWYRDNWLGRAQQVNTWDDDGYRFFGQHRLLRWLPEPRVQAALDAEDRRALERLCAALPELLPHRPACLTHGDLWSQNLLSTADGNPAVIDPAVSYTWAEVDLAQLWSNPRPPESERFFDVYAEVTGLEPGWPARLRLLHLRQLLTIIAQHDHDWGAAEQAREILAPFRRSGNAV
jgi:fructosamine-3-kinase